MHFWFILSSVIGVYIVGYQTSCKCIFLCSTLFYEYICGPCRVIELLKISSNFRVIQMRYFSVSYEWNKIRKSKKIHNTKVFFHKKHWDDTKDVFKRDGSLLSESVLESAIEKARNNFNLLCQRILSLDAHRAMFFLTHYVSAPQLTYLLRSAPVFKRKQKLSEIDDLLRATLSQTVNVHMRDDMWEQATLPTRHGGLGIKRLSDLFIPCFAS